MKPLLLLLYIVFIIIINKVSTSSYDDCPFYRKAFETAGLGNLYDFVVETDDKYHNKSILTSIKESGQMFYKEIVDQRDSNIDILQRDGLYGYFKHSIILSIPEYISKKLKTIRKSAFGNRMSVKGPDITINENENENRKDDYFVQQTSEIFDLLIDYFDKSIIYTSKKVL